MLRSTSLPATTAARHALRRLGGAIVVLQTGDLLKAHIRADAPDAVFALGASWGSVESTKAEDMRAQHRELPTNATGRFVSNSRCCARMSSALVDSTDPQLASC